MYANGYATIQRQTLSGRALEREVFSRITGRLSTADRNAHGGGAAFYEALCDNKKLWMTLALDLVKETNTCPPDLKRSLLGIAAFVETHTARVIEGGATADILVEINQNILKGLSLSVSDEAA